MFPKKNHQPWFPWNFRDPISRNQKKYYQNSAAKKVVFSVENSPAFTAQHRDGFRANDFRHFRPFFLRRFPRKSGPNTKVFRRLRGTGEKKEECECHSELRKKMEFSWAWRNANVETASFARSTMVFLFGQILFHVHISTWVFWFCSTDSYENNVVTLQCISRLIGWWIKSWSLKPNVKLRRPFV